MIRKYLLLFWGFLAASHFSCAVVTFSIELNKDIEQALAEVEGNSYAALRVFYENSIPNDTLFISGENLPKNKLAISRLNILMLNRSSSKKGEKTPERASTFSEAYVSLLKENKFPFEEKIDYLALLKTKLEKVDQFIFAYKNNSRLFLQRFELREALQKWTRIQQSIELEIIKNKYKNVAETSLLRNDYFNHLLKVFENREDSDMGMWYETSRYYTDEALSPKKKAIEKILSEENNDLIEMGKHVPFGVPETLEEDIKFENNIGSDGSIRFYLKFWGQHAEDVLVFQIISNIKKHKRVPSKIEIYGTLDPCVHCQVKLQWLAELLGKQIDGADINRYIEDKHDVEIHYISRNKCETQCVVKLPFLTVKQQSPWYTTRNPASDKRVKKFIFSSKKTPEESSVECFNVFNFNLESEVQSAAVSDVIRQTMNNHTPYIRIALQNYQAQKKAKQVEVCKQYVETIYDAYHDKSYQSSKLTLEISVYKTGSIDDLYKTEIIAHQDKTLLQKNLCS